MVRLLLMAIMALVIVLAVLSVSILLDHSNAKENTRKSFEADIDAVADRVQKSHFKQ